MGRREAAEKGLWKLRAAETKWALFVPLHRLWCGYICELLGLLGEREREQIPPAVVAGMHAKLVKADFHGSIVTGTCAVRVFCLLRMGINCFFSIVRQCGGVGTLRWLASLGLWYRRRRIRSKSLRVMINLKVRVAPLVFFSFSCCSLSDDRL